MFGLGAGEIFLIVLFALIFIGPKKIPELARGMGKALREFQRAKDDLMTNVHDEPGHDGHDAGVTHSETPEVASDESLQSTDSTSDDANETEKKPEQQDS